MVKSKVVVLVDSVEDAVKFYTEKLSFDLMDLALADGDSVMLASAVMRKGKFGITFRQPHVEELAAFSFIKRCANRCVYVTVDIKRDIERFFERCVKKGVKVTKTLSLFTSGAQGFIIRDPFGIELTFIQDTELTIIPAREVSLCGFTVDHDALFDSNYHDRLAQDAIDRLRTIGIVRRAAKKLIKTKLKELAA